MSIEYYIIAKIRELKKQINKCITLKTVTRFKIKSTRQVSFASKNLQTEKKKNSSSHEQQNIEQFFLVEKP